MQNSHKKRICIVTRSLGEGGSDRVASLQSIFLNDLGYDVYVVSILNWIKYPYKGTLLNLGKLKEQEDTALGRIKRFVIFRNFLRRNEIDIIIDHRVRIKTLSEFIISLLLYKKKVIYIVHNSTIYKYFPSLKWMAKFTYRNAKKIVAVSKEIETKIRKEYNLNNVITIYNPINFDYINKKNEVDINVDYEYIFWYGRFEEEQKNLSLLINAYKSSTLPSLKIKLVLMGRGKDKSMIVNLITLLNLNDSVDVLPFSTNPFAFISKSIFVVLSSKYEGFPMTILESLASGVPVISVKYNYGVNEIIKSEYNGLLVQNNDSEALSQAFNRFISDKKLYFYCKNNALFSVKKYSITNIANEWQQLIDN